MGKPVRHRTKPQLIKCPQCGAWVAYGIAIDPPQFGCGRRYKVEPTRGAMCQQTRIELLEIALGRAVAPECYDERGRMIRGSFLAVDDAKRAAIRQANATRGPTDIDFGKTT